jgi:NDP-sugar pyrophosphorylase family protein
MNGIYSLVALVLAGGAGTRMGQTTPIPKVYLPVGIEPVINRPVNKALAIQDVTKVYNLTRKSHPDLKNVNLEDWATQWKQIHYPSNNKVGILFEEDLLAQNPPVHIGAVVALKNAIDYFNKQNPPRLTS